jgi:hypothetical protein
MLMCISTAVASHRQAQKYVMNTNKYKNMIIIIIDLLECLLKAVV